MHDSHNCFPAETAEVWKDVEDAEEEGRLENEEQAAKSTPQQKKRPRRHPPKYRPQQEETGYGPRGRPSLESSRREEVAPLVRRSPRKKGLSVAEFAKQVQDGGQAKKQTIKLAGRVLDPHVMSSSKESDASDSTHTMRRSPHKHSAPTTQGNASLRRLVGLNSSRSQPSEKRRKVPPEGPRVVCVTVESRYVLAAVHVVVHVNV